MDNGLVVALQTASSFFCDRQRQNPNYQVRAFPAEVLMIAVAGIVFGLSLFRSLKYILVKHGIPHASPYID